jgi:hypothetical protein
MELSRSFKDITGDKNVNLPMCSFLPRASVEVLYPLLAFHSGSSVPSATCLERVFHMKFLCLMLVMSLFKMTPSLAQVPKHIGL